MRTTAASGLPSAPRRSQPGSPARSSRRGEMAAGLATVALVGQLLILPVAVPVALVLLAVGRLSRWRPDWLLVPLAAGVGWLAAADPSRTVPMLAADPGRVTSGLAHLAAHPARWLRDPGAGTHWLSGELPAALVVAALEVGVLTWLVGRRSRVSWRPALAAAARRWHNRAQLAAGQTMTRAGCAIGLDARTGRLIEISRADAARGVLLAGTDAADLVAPGAAVACAAIHRRTTVLAVDLGGQSGSAAAVVASLAHRRGVPLAQVSRAPEVAAAVSRAVRARSVVVCPGAGAALVEELTGALAQLRERGLRGDCLLWLSGCEAVEPGPLAALLALGPATGTAVLFTTTTAASAGVLAAHTGLTIACGPVSAELAAVLSPGPRANAAEVLARQRPGEFTVIGTDCLLAGCRAVPSAVPQASAVVPQASAAAGCPSAAGLAAPGNGTIVRSTAPPGRFRPDLVYIGWRPAAEPDPGPPPVPPAAAGADQVSADWLAAQRRERARLSGATRLAGALGIAMTTAVTTTWLAGWLPAGLALVTGVGAVVVTGRSASGLWRGSRVLARRVQAEERRVAGWQAAERDETAAQRQQYARQLRGWQQRAAAFARRPHWHPVTVPVAVGRVDVAGGTLTGWSALLTTLAVARLAAGGEVTVVDLTDGGVAADLLAVARHQGVQPLVWLLPADLPRLGLGADFTPELLADVLARTVAAAGGPAAADGQHDVARDASLLRRVLAALGDNATLAQLTAALRVLGQIGGPANHLGSADLTPQQLASLSTLAGRGAEQYVIDRAWALEARLRVLGPLATAVAEQPQSPLRVVWLDRRAAPLATGALAAYLVVALAEALRQSRLEARWQRAVFLFGAERLPADVLDRLSDAAEVSGTGLVCGYRSMPPHVRDRIGRGGGAVAFMRLGNAADAKLAAEQIGSEHRFVLSQLTETVGTSVTETAGASYTATAGTTRSVADSQSVTHTSGRSEGRGRSGAGGFAPFAAVAGSASRDASFSAALSDSRSVTAAINTGTSWGLSTSRAVGATDSVATAAQRTREFVVEPHELQRLPTSAVVLSYPGTGGRRLVLADANPAIMTLPTATLAAPAPDQAGPSARIDP